MEKITKILSDIRDIWENLDDGLQQFIMYSVAGIIITMVFLKVITSIICEMTENVTKTRVKTEREIMLKNGSGCPNCKELIDELMNRDSQ